jgi:hypothetical protein
MIEAVNGKEKRATVLAADVPASGAKKPATTGIAKLECSP